MRIVAWNVGFQTHSRDIPSDVVQALAAPAPDVLVLIAGDGDAYSDHAPLVVDLTV